MKNWILGCIISVKYVSFIFQTVLELPKVAMHEYPQTVLLNWARFINAEEREELEMLAETDEFIRKAYEKLLDISADEEKRLEYEEREKAIRDYNHQIHSYWNQGLKEGQEKGIQAYIELSIEIEASREATLERLMQKFSITEKEAREYIDKYWNEGYTSPL